jgi:hypothetical protein
MRSLETITMPFLLFLEGYISAFFWVGDHNFEIRIGSKGSVNQARGVRWGWECCPPMPGMSDPVCPGPPLQPVTPPPVYACLCTFIFPLIPFRGSHRCCHV